jgi:hypothetical protein
MSKLRLMRSAVSRRPDTNNPSDEKPTRSPTHRPTADEILLDIDDW